MTTSNCRVGMTKKRKSRRTFKTFFRPNFISLLGFKAKINNLCLEVHALAVELKKTFELCDMLTFSATAVCKTSAEINNFVTLKIIFSPMKINMDSKCASFSEFFHTRRSADPDIQPYKLKISTPVTPVL